MAEKRLEGKRVLLVDDEPDVLETLEDLLPECETVPASSFAQARDLLQSERFDLAVLDIMGVDGYALLEIAAKKKVTTVMLTARAFTPQSVARSIRGGADFYIPKENLAEIGEYLEEVLETKEKGEDPWGNWFHRFAASCERRFGPDWQKGDQVLWERFPFY